MKPVEMVGVPSGSQILTNETRLDRLYFVTLEVTLVGADSFFKDVFSMIAKLTETEIQTHLAKLPNWHRDGDIIQRTFKFKNFIEAIAFVNKLVEPAETADHHPDLIVGYGKVVVNLSTHDAGGLTQKDFELAETFDQI